MLKTEVVNIKYETCDIFINRYGKWGNPYHIGKLTRDECIEKYREWIQTKPELLNALGELLGKRLGCHCVPSNCHGTVLLDLLEATYGGHRLNAFELEV